MSKENKHFQKLPESTKKRIRKANPPGSQPDPGPGGLGTKLYKWLNKSTNSVNE